MKKKFAILFLNLATILAAFASLAWGQGFPTSTAPGRSPTLENITFPIFTLNAVPIPGASLQVVGAPGQATWCYWGVANFQIGSVLSPLGCVSNAANTLTSSNYVSVIPFQYPASVLTVDILATPTNQAPTGVCNCAVATGLSVGGTNQQSNSLSPYTVSILTPAAFNLCLRNEVVGTGSSHLLLRNCLTGALISDLSISTSGVTGSGTAGTLPAWLSGGTSLGNSLISETGLGATGNINFAAAFLNINSASGGTSFLSCTSCVDLNFSAPNGGGAAGGTIQLTPPNSSGLGSSVQFSAANESAVLQSDSNSHAGASASLILPIVTFPNLPTGSANAPGGIVYCSTCHTATQPCSTAGGTGAGTFAFQINGVWECPF